MAADERKPLRLRRSLENAERQRQGASPLNDDDVGESRDSKGDDEEFEVLKCSLDES